MSKNLKEERKQEAIAKAKKEKTIKLLVIIGILFGILIINLIKTNQDVKTNNENTIPGFELLAESDFDKEEVLAMGYPTMLDVGGEDCIPCKNMAHVLVELNEELMGEAIIKFVDYWKYSHLANQFDFRVIPTQFFYDEDGNLYKTHQGEIDKDGILEIFAEMGYDFSG